jgi:hypothetical protein
MHGQLLAARSKRVGSFAALKVPRVCAQCNNGWMARMEDRIRPVVSPLVRGESCSLDLSALRQIAAWTELKSLTLDASYGDDRYLPSSLAHDFCCTSQPLRGTRVMLGVCTPAPDKPIRWGRRSFHAITTLQGSTPRFIKVTLALKCVVAQVIIGSFETHVQPVNLVFPACDQRLVQVWPPPTSGHFEWPPPTATIPPAEFASIA